MQLDDKILHLPTGTVGTFIWEAPTGHVMFREGNNGKEVLAYPGTCELYDPIRDGVISDYIKWIPALIVQICEDTCTCGGQQLEGEDKPLKLCGRCMAERLLNKYSALAPDALQVEIQKHAAAHGFAHIFRSVDEWLGLVQRSN